MCHSDFAVSPLICLTQIVGMQPGGERRLIIPAKLAYGKSGTQGIPGNGELQRRPASARVLIACLPCLTATLTFEVKLLSIK